MVPRLTVISVFKVNEVFYSLHGEGAYAGTPSVFCRFSGCNMWSGLPGDKASSACPFCDTDFVGGVKVDEDELFGKITAAWPAGKVGARVVFTGGEPTLQLTDSLVARLKRANFNVAIETNGYRKLELTQPCWVTVSPKRADILVRKGAELKLLYPHLTLTPDQFADLDFRHFYLQPIAGPDYASNLAAAATYCLENPQWRLSLQTHKIIGLR